MIADAIRADGPISFARFMELALYHPEVGYYTRPQADVGPAADYVTSPEVHPAFGALLCTQFVELWEQLGKPVRFWLVEGGPGRGLFARDVLETAAAAYPSFAATLQIALVERSPALRAQQRETLASWSERVRWLPDDPSLWEPVGAGCVFANELLDAFPVHRVVMGAPAMREVFVALADDALVEAEGEPATAELARQIAAGGGQLGAGHRGEVNLLAPSWVRAATRLIERGYLFLLDYGAPADLLYGPAHPRGTLRCYYRQTMHEDPLIRVGLQDMTAHVDLSAVTRAALDEGLTLVGATDQARLLGRLGLVRLQEDLPRHVSGRAEQRAHRAALDLLVTPARAVTAVPSVDPTDAGHDPARAVLSGFGAPPSPGGLGDVRAIAFAKGVASGPLAGFARTTGAALPRLDWLWRMLRLDPRRSLAVEPSRSE